MKEKEKQIKTSLAALGAILAAVILAAVLIRLEIKADHLLLIFLLSTIVVTLITKSMLLCMAVAAMFVAVYNYYCIVPLHSFAVYSPDTVITMVIFYLIVVIISLLNKQLQRQAQIARENERITHMMYQFSRGLADLSTPREVVDYGNQRISELFGVKTRLYCYNDTGSVPAAAAWCMENGCKSGHNEVEYAGEPAKYYPLLYRNKTVGAVEMDCSRGELPEEKLETVMSLMDQVYLARERYILRESREAARMQIERERYKTSLLRSISHDLRTPLTGILGGTAFLIDSLDQLDPDTVRDLLTDINTDTEWLYSMVDNLLNMSRIQDGRLKVNPHGESVDDVISTVVSRVQKRIGKHNFTVNKPHEVVIASIDGQLISQVLINFLDNAFSHTRPDCDVCLSVSVSKGSVLFEVWDNGGGIPEADLDHLFESFYTANTTVNTDKRRGTGLGLSICKTIIDAHNGVCSVANNKEGGTTFTVSLPLEA